MPRKGAKVAKASAAGASTPARTRPSALLDTRIIYCGDCLDRLAKLPDGCVDRLYLWHRFPTGEANSNRNYEVFWRKRSEPRAPASGPPAHVEDRHASTQAYIDYMRPRCVELARVLKKTGSFYYHCDWHASSRRPAALPRNSSSTLMEPADARLL